jgi:hypothetical protein
MKENVVIPSLGLKVIAVLLVYLEGKMTNKIVFLFLGHMFCFIAPDFLDKMVVMVSMD